MAQVSLSTRSTHPTTLQRVNDLLAALELTVQITNPFADLTKGEARVAGQAPPAGCGLGGSILALPSSLQVPYLLAGRGRPGCRIRSLLSRSQGSRSAAGEGAVPCAASTSTWSTVATRPNDQ
jgi:hypothetical protein